MQPTGNHVWWYGTPIFTFEGGLVRDLWVLGDIHGLMSRLKEERPGESIERTFQGPLRDLWPAAHLKR